MYIVVPEQIGCTVRLSSQLEPGKRVEKFTDLLSIIKPNGECLESIYAISELKVLEIKILDGTVLSQDLLGKPFFTFEEITVCDHSIILGNLCGLCGADLHVLGLRDLLRDKQVQTLSNTPLTGDTPQHRESEDNLFNEALEHNKLLLVLDLDHTLIHASSQDCLYDRLTLPHVPFAEALERFDETLGLPEFIISIENLPELVKFNRQHVMYYSNYDENPEVRRRIMLLENQLFLANALYQISPSLKISMSNYYKLRPGVYKFLRDTSKYFDLILYTAGDYSHMISALNIIDPDRRFFKRAMCRQHLLPTGLKSVAQVTPNDVTGVLAIDDTRFAWTRLTPLINCPPYVFFDMGQQLHYPSLLFEPHERAQLWSVSTLIQQVFHFAEQECGGFPQSKTIVSSLKALSGKKEFFTGCASRQFCSVRDFDDYLRALFNFLKLSHQTYFDVVNYALDVSEGADEVRVGSLGGIAKLLMSHILKNVVIFVPEYLSEFTASNAYLLSVELGAVFVSDVDKLDQSDYVLILEESNTELIAEYANRKCIGIDWLLECSARFWRLAPVPPSNFGSGYRHFLSKIVDDFPNSSDSWSACQGIAIAECTGQVNHAKPSSPDVSSAQQKKLAVDDELCNDVELINYSRWKQKHNFRLEEHLDDILANGTTLPSALLKDKCKVDADQLIF